MKIVDKEEFRIKLDQINHLVEVKDYKGAMEVVDSIDWRRVKNVRTLCVVGEIYAANKRYEDSRDIFLLAYHRASIGKNILYRLIEVSLKMGEIDEAMDYYEEFCSVAPNDNTAYVLRYKILKARNAPLEDQIQVLEEYKSREFTEKWSYELAKLYYRAGEKEKCSDLCSEIILWFSEGGYVMKAYEMKMRMGTLTEREKENYEKYLEESDHKKLSSQKDEEKEIKEEKSEEQEPVIEEIEIKKEKNKKQKKEIVEEIEEEPEEISEEEEEDSEEINEEYEEGSDEIIEEVQEESGEIVEEVIEILPEEELYEEKEDSDDNIEEDIDSDEESDEEETDEEQSEETEEDEYSGYESEEYQEEYDDEEEEEEIEEDEDEYDYEDSEISSFDDDESVIENIEVDNEKDIDSAETLQERIVKGIRDLFGGKKKEKEETESDEEFE